MTTKQIQIILFKKKSAPTCPESSNKDPTSTGLWNMISSTDTINGLEPLSKKKEKFLLKNNEGVWRNLKHFIVSILIEGY